MNLELNPDKINSTQFDKPLSSSKRKIIKSSKKIFLDLIKKRDIFLCGILLPLLFLVGVAFVTTLVQGGKGINSSNLGALTLSSIHMTTMVMTIMTLVDKISEDRKNNASFEFYEFIGRILAHLIYLGLNIILILLVGVLLGAKFHVNLDTLFISFYSFTLFILVSFGFGLILSSIQKKEISIVLGFILTVFSTIYFIISSIRPYFFNRFPVIIHDILQYFPFISNSASIISSLVGEHFSENIQSLNALQFLFLSIVSLVLFFVGVTVHLHDKNMTPKNSSVGEKTISFMEFSKPAFVACLFLSLRFVIELALALILFFLDMVEDIRTQKLIIALITPIIGITIIYFLILPWLKMKKVESKTLMSRRSVFISLSIFSMLSLSLIVSSVFFIIFASRFDINDILFFNLTTIPIDNMNTIIENILWLIALTIGVASLKEYLFRRSLIPMLESFGFSTIATIIASSLVFGLLHSLQSLGIQINFFQAGIFSFSANYDFNSIIIYASYQFWVSFLLGVACSSAFLITRNIFYPILIHSITNLLILVSYFYSIHENQLFMITLVILISFIIIFGLNLLFYFRKTILNDEWKDMISVGFSKRINRGHIGYISLFIGILSYVSFYPFSNMPAVFVVIIHIWILVFLTYKSKPAAVNRDIKAIKIEGDLS